MKLLSKQLVSSLRTHLKSCHSGHFSFRPLRGRKKIDPESRLFSFKQPNGIPGSFFSSIVSTKRKPRNDSSVLVVVAFLALFSGLAHAADPKTDEGVGPSGLPLPRFASMRSNETNMRTGPGTRYPIDWVLVSKGMPVEIIAEYEYWRRIRDWEGSEGWVHKAALTGKRGAVVIKTMRDLRQKDDPNSPIMAHLEPGAVGQILSCKPEWCRIKFGDIKGYLRKNEFWGAYKDEVFN